MGSYCYNRTIDINGLGPRGLEPREELMKSTFYPLAAKRKNRRLFPDILSRLKEYFYPLAAKEKNKRYILYWLPAHKRSIGKRYVWKCVDKNSWEYWEYYWSDGHPGRWPATGPALLGLFMIWLVYTLLLGILSRLKEYFYPLAAKKKNL